VSSSWVRGLGGVHATFALCFLHMGALSVVTFARPAIRGSPDTALAPTARAPASVEPPRTRSRHMPPQTMTQETTTHDVRLVSRVTRHADRLEVHYVLTNGTTGRLAVLNQVSAKGVDGARHPSPNHAYVDFQQGSAHVFKAALDTRGMLFCFGNSSDPDAELLEPGAAASETFVVPLPLKVREPMRKQFVHKSAEVIASKESAARELVVSIGVVPVAGSACGFVAEDPTRPNIHAAHVRDPDRPLHSCQTLVSTRFALDADLPVLDYEAHPEP
jgi:hypothetical protein